MMGKIKTTVKKVCPECSNPDVAVACKFCPKCKYSFASKKDAYVPPPSAIDPVTGEPKEPNPDNRRRTERVKRVKPNFYDASEFETKPKKRRRGPKPNKDKNEALKSSAVPDLRRKPKQKRKNAKKAKDLENESPRIYLTPEKLQQCSIILAELNRKMAVTAWRI